MNRDVEVEPVQYVIPSRTISGPAPDVLREVDEVIEVLWLARTALLARLPFRTPPDPAAPDGTPPTAR